MRHNESSGSLSAAPPIAEPVLREMNRLGMSTVKIRLAAALQQGRERVPVQSPGLLGEAPTCVQVVEWVSLKEAKKDRTEWWLINLTLVFAFIGATAAVIGAIAGVIALERM